MSVEERVKLVLRACEAAVYRLATDMHYFAKPSKTLFNDIRIYFPMASQRRVYCVVDRYLTFCREWLAALPVPRNGRLRGRSALRGWAAGLRA